MRAVLNAQALLITKSENHPPGADIARRRNGTAQREAKRPAIAGEPLLKPQTPAFPSRRKRSRYAV
jgi:hypothetical protein